MLPLTRVPFWGYPIFDPQPSERSCSLQEDMNILVNQLSDYVDLKFFKEDLKSLSHVFALFNVILLALSFYISLYLSLFLSLFSFSSFFLSFFRSFFLSFLPSFLPSFVLCLSLSLSLSFAGSSSVFVGPPLVFLVSVDSSFFSPLQSTWSTCQQRKITLVRSPCHPAAFRRKGMLGCWDAGDVGDAGDAGDPVRAILTVFTLLFEGWVKRDRSPSQGWGCQGCFWVQLGC